MRRLDTLRMQLASLASAVLASLLLASTSQAGPLNAGFETGSYPPWLEQGNNAVITNLGTIPAPAGNFMSCSSTGAVCTPDTTPPPTPVSDTVLEIFLGLAPGTLDAMANDDVTEGSAIRQDFVVLTPGGETVTFLWNFLTNEPEFTGTNDTAFFVLDGVATELADTPSPSMSAGGTGFARQTGWHTLTLTNLALGPHRLGFGVVDVLDADVDSALLVDSPQPATEPATIALLGIALAGLGFSRRKRAPN